ncbi:Hypothetical protein POVN_LOCUS476 [uncultured virus]|nr:Hypothetical protein POVN_LOCUS476 [uncultured virus]
MTETDGLLVAIENDNSEMGHFDPASYTQELLHKIIAGGKYEALGVPREAFTTTLVAAAVKGGYFYSVKDGVLTKNPCYKPSSRHPVIRRPKLCKAKAEPKDDTGVLAVGMAIGAALGAGLCFLLRMKR